MVEIKFGTDGWRAVISDAFTFQNLRRVSQAVCDVARKNSKSRLILVGYDNRFFSDRFAETAAQVALANGFRVEMSQEPLSSPALAQQTKDRRAAVGLMITASHNPAIFNGFKIKGAHGGSVDEIYTKLVEDRIDAGEIQYGNDKAKTANFIGGYVSAFKKVVKGFSLGAYKGKIVFDAMHGPGAKIFEEAFGQPKNVVFIRGERDPLFGGVNPEPIETNLTALKEAVIREKASIGIAVDGDVDRIGIVDEKGRYWPPHIVMPLILLHLIEDKGMKGKVLQTVSLGYLSARIAQHFKLPYEELPVGFKHIAKKMVEEKILFGGEESGGYGFGFWIPERDAMLCAVYLIQMMIKRKKPLSILIEDLQSRFGASHFKRVDFELKEAFDKAVWTQHMVTHVGTQVGAFPVKQVLSGDGVKVITQDDSWFLMRPSGTEPLVRTYSEGTSPAIVADLLKEAERLIKIPIPNPQRDAEEKNKAARRRRAASKNAAKISTKK